jgi:1-acyl-sn-glycerol-3-phosphate acyltransferase
MTKNGLLDRIFAGKNPRLIFFEGDHIFMISVRLFLKCVVQLYYKVSHRVSVRGLEKLPVCGPYIVASNHISNHDPILLAAFLNHNINFLINREWDSSQQDPTVQSSFPLRFVLSNVDSSGHSTSSSGILSHHLIQIIDCSLNM